MMDRSDDRGIRAAPRTAPRTTLPTTLRLLRVPGEFGVIVRCFGELSTATIEALERELMFLEPLDHPLLTLNLAGCHLVDLDGVRSILRSARRLRGRGRRLVVVAGTGAVARELQMLRLDWIIPVYPTEEAAALVLRGWSPPLPGPGTWEAARAETIIHWHMIQEAVDQVPSEILLRLLTSMSPLCDQAEERFHAGEPAGQDYPNSAPLLETRCQCCPLFHTLGGQREDVGCRSLLDPIIAAVRAGDRPAAAALIQGVIQILNRMPLREEADESRHPAIGSGSERLSTDSAARCPVGD